MKPRTPQRRTVVFSRPLATMPNAWVVGPAARPPTLKSLQSMVTLLTVTLIAVPVVRFIDTFLRRHQTPCVETVAGSESMKPVQLS